MFYHIPHANQISLQLLISNSFYQDFIKSLENLSIIYIIDLVLGALYYHWVKLSTFKFTIKLGLTHYKYETHCNLHKSHNNLGIWIDKMNILSHWKFINLFLRTTTLFPPTICTKITKYIFISDFKTSIALQI